MTDQWLTNYDVNSPSSPSVQKSNLRAKIESRVKKNSLLKPLLDGYNAEIEKFGTDQPPKGFINVLIDHLNREYLKWENDTTNYVYSPMEDHPADRVNVQEKKGIGITDSDEEGNEGPKDGDILSDEKVKNTKLGDESDESDEGDESRKLKKQNKDLMTVMHAVVKLLAPPVGQSQTFSDKQLNKLEASGFFTESELEDIVEARKKLENSAGLAKELEKASAEANRCKLIADSNDTSILQLNEKHKKELEELQEEFKVKESEFMDEIGKIRRSKLQLSNDKDDAIRAKDEAEEVLRTSKEEQQKKIKEIFDNLENNKEQLNEQFRQEKEALENEITNLKTQKTSQEERSESLEGELTTLKRRNENLTAAIKAKEDEIDGLKLTASTDEALQKYIKNMEAMNKVLNEKNERLELSEVEVERLQIKLGRYEILVGEIEEEKEVLVGSAQVSKTENESLTKKVRQLESEKSELEKNIAEISNAKKQKESDIEELSRLRQEGAEKIERLELELTKQTTEIDQLKESVKTNSELAESNSKMYSAMANRKQQLEQQLEILHDEYSELLRQFDAYKKMIADQSVQSGNVVDADEKEKMEKLRIELDIAQAAEQQRLRKADSDLKKYLDIPDVRITGDFIVEASEQSNSMHNRAFIPKQWVIMNLSELETALGRAQSFKKYFDDRDKIGITGSGALYGGIGTALTLGQTIHRMGYSALVKQRVDGPNSLRLDFRDAKGGRHLTFTVNRLAPRVLHMGASPALVADIGKKASHIDYRYVTQFDRDLIPSKGSVEIERFNGTAVQYSDTLEYELQIPPVERPYGTEAMVEFEDGTRLYTTYVTASLYALNLIVMPYFPKETV